MKTILLLAGFVLVSSTSKAQYSQNFEGTEADLAGNCWTLNGIYKTSDASDVINGTGSMFTNPPTSGSGTRDIISPALNVLSPLFNVSFKYKVSSQINGLATRTIEIGVLDNSSNYTSLHTITLTRFSPTTVQTFNQNFILAFIGVKRLVLKLGGAQGDGNSRLIFDDLYTNASPKYGTGTCNSAPVAVDDVFHGAIGAVITGNILSNDNEPNGEVMMPSVVSNPNHGVLSLNALGNFVFTPNVGFNGNSVSFTYRLTDNGVDPMTSNTATVTINYLSGTILPVKLISFSAFLNNSKVDLNWTTAEEINVSHFVIEKSTDGQNFSDAGTVFAFGNSTSRNSYGFSDNLGTMRSGVLYYRLRSVDIDGKSQYSETRVIRLDKKAENTITILTFPNPVSNELKVTIPSNWQNKKVSYELFKLNGQLAGKKETSNSSQTESINVSSLTAGMYMVRVSCEGETAQQKIVKN